MKHETLLIILCTLLLGSCAQLTPFHSARTEGAGQLTLTPTIDGTVFIPSGSNTSGLQGLPGGRAELAYGISNNLDVIASVYTSLSFMGSFKYQFWGDNESNIAAALMPGYEYQSSPIVSGTESASIQRIHIPLIFSIRGNETMDFYLGPKYVYQFDKNEENTSFTGITGGVVLGKNRIKYNLGLGAFLPITKNVQTEGYLIQFGGSMRIPLFGKD